MNKLTILLRRTIVEWMIKFSNILSSLANWIEFSLELEKYPRNISRAVSQIGRKIHPESYCSKCGVPLEGGCYDGRYERTPETRMYCCNCGHYMNKTSIL